MRTTRSHSISTSTAATPVSEPTRRWIVAAAKLGYAAKAIVYATIGVVALLAAAHTGGHTTGSHGAFVAILSQPFGRVLLGMLGVGLAGYALWRLVQAVMAGGRGATSAVRVDTWGPFGLLWGRWIGGSPCQYLRCVQLQC